MKKLLSLTLALILVLSIFSSCVAFVPNNTGSDTKTDTETNTTTETNTNTETETNTNTETETNTDIAVGGSDTETSTDTSSDVNKEPEKPEIPPEKIETWTWQFNYSYGELAINSIGNPIAELLVNNLRFGKGLESIEIPENIVAGDKIKIEYTGELYLDEAYPSLINLDGELVSYSFKYASVTKDVLTLATLDRIMTEYDIKDKYIIINRNGEYKDLEDSTGRYIYLVTDQEREKEQLEGQGLPIASIFIYDPRDPNVGLSPVSPRNEKVSFDLDYHHFGDEIKDYYKEDPTKFDYGYICNDENGNEYIAYAPNVYKYTVLIECTEDKNDVYGWIDNALNQFDPWYTDVRDILIDTQDLPNNMILITFPDFDTYFACQDELLDKISVLECVKKIHVSYINTQNGTYTPKNTYGIYADLGNKYHKNDVFTTYEEYVNALGTCIENNSGLNAITKSTFESNYVFVVTNHHHREFVISDARLVGDTVYFTNNEFQSNGEWVDAIEYANSCVIAVPKAKIGTLPENAKVKTVDATIYIEGFYNATTIDEGEAIAIAFAHFYANYNLILDEGFAYLAKSIDGANTDDYWYILIYLENSEYDYVALSGCFTYTIDKMHGTIIDVKMGE